ncbi:hypothetical protein Fleli_0207 [Bernardetia litoralis DSM 6794]|uniref:Uncharacterized protein n=1 Tax=Bernardetia litoralis (strain ATCC 23117 / DSM 6794 / NBRC 15988 / NCIMB 1366 / Fx l1 / Sio-4) TaxID=880071 RepID=I4AFG8_BERLS|nr:hypothetical protein [Bernardetia litoralis]AFM02703.1 hypothetical protein Fleli_0207 [Bernardetia litoralis DSM 6794]
MSNYFSIEEAITKIYNHKTKSYFNEVYETFVNENYRSSIVMLYSVLICDLIFKLRDLRDIYRDDRAKKILEDVEKLQINNPTSPDWESKLIDFIFKNLDILEKSDEETIRYLQKQRHLSAHPVLTQVDMLYAPDKYTTLHLIKTMLDRVFTQPPYFSNKIFETFITDLAEVKDILGNDSNQISSYINSKYISKMKEESLAKLFRTLWKITFMVDDDLSNENRKINFLALKAIFSFKSTFLMLQIENEKKYYSNNINKSNYFLLATLLFKHHNIFYKLDSTFQDLYKTYVDNSEKEKSICWFFYPSLADYINALNNKDLDFLLRKNALLSIKSLFYDNGFKNEFMLKIISYFLSSNTYDRAIMRSIALNSIITDINEEQCHDLLQSSNENNQIYGAYRLPDIFDNKFISKFRGIDINNYPNLVKEDWFL